MKMQHAVEVAMDWLAQLREEGHEEPSRDNDEPTLDTDEPSSDTEDNPPTVDARSAVPLPRRAAIPRPAAEPPAAAAPTVSESGRRTGIRAPVEITERAAIGDELRIPIAWCEMGSCISHYGDPEALGEADIRARAIDAGWRVDALRRLACPKCQQSDSWFWAASPVALWDRDRALAMVTLVAVAARHATTDGRATGAEAPPVAPSDPAVPLAPIRVWHPDRSDGVTGEGIRGNDQTG